MNKKALYDKQRRQKHREKLIEYKGGCCQECRQRFPDYIYELHHVNPAEKDMNVGRMLSWSWAKIQAEADKCVLLCANCHKAIHHYLREDKIG